MEKDDADIDVARACLYIAMHRRATLDVEHYMRRLDEMGAELQARLPPADSRVTRRMLKAINSYLYDEGLGFRGADAEEYTQPDSSCFDQVLDRKRGLPIMMSLLYLELARRVRFPMAGVNLPSHFMARPRLRHPARRDQEHGPRLDDSGGGSAPPQVRPLVEGSEMLVDPFNGGEMIDVPTAEARLAPLYGQGVKITIDTSFFADSTSKPRTFLTRVLTNLKQLYFNSGAHDDALLMIDYQQYAAPDRRVRALNSRDRGICLFMAQRYADAVAELQGYLAAFPEAVDLDAIRQARRRPRRACAGRPAGCELCVLVGAGWTACLRPTTARRVAPGQVITMCQDAQKGGNAGGATGGSGDAARGDSYGGGGNEAADDEEDEQPRGRGR